MTDAAIPRAISVPAGLSERLKMVQRRAAQRQAVRSLFVAATATLATFTLLGAGYLLAGRPASWVFGPVAGERAGIAGPLLQTGIAATLVGLVVLAGLAVLNRHGGNDIGSHARAADRRFGRKERFSTALEVAGDRRGLSAVSQALMIDVAAHVAAIDPRDLVPVRISGPILAAAAMALFIGAAMLAALTYAPAAGVGTGATLPAQPAILAEAEREDVAEEIRRIAMALAEDAERRDDPYLGAIARELERVAEAVATEPTLDRAGLTADLERLRANTADAYGRAGETAGATGDLTRLVDGALREVIEGPRGASPLSPEPGPRPAMEGGEPAAPAAGEPGPDAAAPAAFPPGAMPSPTPPGPGAAANTDDLYELEALNVAAAEAARRAARNLDQPGQLAGAVPIGAAADAGIGEGDAAGRGVRPLEGGAVTEFGTPPEIAGEMVLEDAREGDGRRLRMDTAPPGAGTGIPLAEGERTDAGWRQLPEQEVTRTIIQPSAADVLTRYFGDARGAR
ncbi:MAG: hypothetical protein KIT43_11075 [Bauldia sp.]|nr:hypothetical protein [Bauldia sp.]MCW5717615.1 hypothetical protein [Bauldia sp.]